MWFNHPDAPLSLWRRRLEPAAAMIGLLMACWDPTRTAGLLLLGAIATLTRLPKLREATPREKLATASFLVGLLLLFLPVTEPIGLLLMLSSLLVRLRPPVALALVTMDVGEDGVWERRSKRWIPFHAIEKVVYDEPVIELIGKGGKRLAAWCQPQNALPMLRELESGVHAARQASDPLRLGRGEMTTEAWLSDLECRFRGAQQYRRQALSIGPLVSALGDKRNRADVRAGAAFVLLSAYPQEGLQLVRSRLSDNSAPLLIAVASLLSPGIVDDECLSEARHYLSPDERAAIESLAGRRARRRCRVAVDLPAGEPAQIDTGSDAGPDAFMHRA